MAVDVQIQIVRRSTVSQSPAATSTLKVVDDYFSCWNETDPTRRRELIAATWAPDARYVDPMFAADGPEALDALAAGVHQQFPGHRFRLTQAPDVHHDRARWGWELAGPDGGQPIAVGVDFAVLAPDGRLREVTGFFNSTASAT
jgi:SnoaL-like domain